MKYYCQLLKNNKGALFGIDARVSMAIFAALSIGIGYYSLGKVQQARTAAFIRELLDIQQAMEEYQADMGTFIRFSVEGGGNGIREFEGLYRSEVIKKGLQKYWNGPYFSKQDSRNHPIYGEYSIEYKTNDRSECKSRKETCYAWLKLTDVPEEAWKAVNAYVDEGGGSKEESNPERQGLVASDSLSDIRVLYYRTVSNKLIK